LINQKIGAFSDGVNQNGKYRKKQRQGKPGNNFFDDRFYALVSPF
jgi:hypothetical protein